ncbi:MAG TPA: pentapeptide repeat-containing protein [Glaciihabitans sp.]|jgi:uncharacterized protein YjbI with pentapeptide repeats|nr:pentapeptide repeat-containing protein [Glaciihabitans sp.]
MSVSVPTPAIPTGDDLTPTPFADIDARRQLLSADCSKCVALCCVALSFTHSSDFAINKAAGEPCENLDENFGCGIHARLMRSGFRGCTVFDCFGAGQQVTQETFAGANWRDTPSIRPAMFEVFPIVRQLNELRFYLSEALALPLDRVLRAETESRYQHLTDLSASDAATLRALDLSVERSPVAELLGRISAAIRANGVQRSRSLPARVRAGADLMGAILRGKDLSYASLRGAYLIGADLSGCDLSFTDLIGADLRDADLSGADLSTALFVTQPQLNSARGSAATLLPAGLSRPAQWSD